MAITLDAKLSHAFKLEVISVALPLTRCVLGIIATVMVNVVLESACDWRGYRFGLVECSGVVRVSFGAFVALLFLLSCCYTQQDWLTSIVPLKKLPCDLKC